MAGRRHARRGDRADDADPGHRPAATLTAVSGQVGGAGKKKNKHKHKKKRDAGAAKPLAPAASEVDWAALVPRATTVDMTAITGVVPSSFASGEILRDSREGLEAMTPDQRSAMFPGSQPSVEISGDFPVVDEPVPTPVQAAPTVPLTARTVVEPPPPAPQPEPAVLHDLAAAQAAVAAVVERERKRPPTAPPVDLRDPRTSQEIATVREDVVAAVHHAFSEDEEAFFSAGKTLEQHHHRPAPAAESFADLDEGYQPQRFWDRLRGRKTEPPPKKR